MSQMVKLAMQVADGVRHLHKYNIIHRDLACRNLLVDSQLEVYVSDFGFARQKDVAKETGFTQPTLGPIKWEAPESLEKKQYSEKSDAYMYGVCLYEMVTGKEPWAGFNPFEAGIKVYIEDRLRVYSR